MTDHLNSIQRVCTNLGSDAELVVGEVYGMRQWSLKPTDGPKANKLVGHQGRAWNVEGENLASCGIGFRPVDRYGTFSTLDWESGRVQGVLQQDVERMFSRYPEINKIELRLWGGAPVLPKAVVYRYEGHPHLLPWKIETEEGQFRVGHLGSVGVLIGPELDIRLQGLKPVPAHEVTDPSCTCGFYAYTSEGSLRANSRNDTLNSIFGIVKAYGHVTEGTRGFRAQKAQIVGLTVPLSYKMRTQLDVPGPTPVYASSGAVTWTMTPYDNGGFLPSFSWQPSAHYNREHVEKGAIPNTIPRFKSFDEMLSVYRKLTGAPEPGTYEAYNAGPHLSKDILQRMMDPGPRPTPDFIRDLLNLNPDPRNP